MDRQIKWSDCTGARTRYHSRQGWDWETFVKIYETPEQLDETVPAKEAKLSLGAIIPAVWKEGYQHREAEGIEHYDILGADVDNSLKTVTDYTPDGSEIITEAPCTDQLTPEIFLDRVKKAGLTALIYETFSCKPGWSKFRAFLPISRKIRPDELEQAIEVMLATLDLEPYRRSLDVKAMRDRARIYFRAGQQHGTPGVWSVAGEWLQVPEDLSQVVVPALMPMEVTEQALAAKAALGLVDHDPSDLKWTKALPVDFATLDLGALLQALGVKVGEFHEVKGGSKARCHCPWPEAHGHGEDDDCGVIYHLDGKWPTFSCSHGHAKGLREICEKAGLELVSQYAEAWEAPAEIDYSQWEALGLPAPAMAAPVLPRRPQGVSEEAGVTTEAPATLGIDLSQFAVAGALPEVGEAGKTQVSPDSPMITVPTAEDDYRQLIRAKLFRRPGKKVKEEDGTVSVTLGAIEANHANLNIIFREDPQFSSNLRMNEQTLEMELQGKPMNETEVTGIHEWLRFTYGIAVQTSTLTEVLLANAKNHPYYPFKEYIDGLKWDEVSRFDWLTYEVMGADNIPIYSTMMRKTMIGACLRADKPGSKVDTITVLVGPQGTRKSTFWRVLAGKDEFYGDGYVDIRNKDGMQVLHQYVIYEHPEIDHMTTKVEASRLKAFASQQSDTFRPPYWTRAHIFLRKFIQVGTTNEFKFLTDDEEYRRFNVIPTGIGGILTDLMTPEIVGQLWAEAYEAYKAGEVCYLNTQDADIQRELNSAHEVDSMYEDALRGVPVIQLQDGLSLSGMMEALSIPENLRNTTKTIRQLTASLKKLGFTSTQEKGGRRLRKWYPCKEWVEEFEVERGQAMKSRNPPPSLLG